MKQRLLAALSGVFLIALVGFAGGLAEAPLSSISSGVLTLDGSTVLQPHDGGTRQMVVPIASRQNRFAVQITGTGTAECVIALDPGVTAITSSAQTSSGAAAGFSKLANGTAWVAGDYGVLKNQPGNKGGYNGACSVAVNYGGNLFYPLCVVGSDSQCITTYGLGSSAECTALASLTSDQLGRLAAPIRCTNASGPGTVHIVDTKKN